MIQYIPTVAFGLLFIFIISSTIIILKATNIPTSQIKK